MLDATQVTPIVTSGVQRAVDAVPGVRRTAVAWLMSWQVPNGQIVTVVAVDPASYAAYTAGVPFPAAPLAQTRVFGRGHDRGGVPGGGRAHRLGGH